MKWVVVLAVAACTSDPPPKLPPDPCNGMVTSVPLTAANHVPEGSPIDWNSNPPTSGDHYPVWADFDEHYDSLERGYWVHDLEHGAIVYAYRCDAGCPDLAAKLDDVVRGLPSDATCSGAIHQRALVVSDPLLPTDGEVTAVAWGSFYAATGQCADPRTLTTFYYQHTAHGPEDTCAGGVVFSGTPIF